MFLHSCCIDDMLYVYSQLCFGALSEWDIEWHCSWALRYASRRYYSWHYWNEFPCCWHSAADRNKWLSIEWSMTSCMTTRLFPFQSLQWSTNLVNKTRNVWRNAFKLEPAIHSSWERFCGNLIDKWRKRVSWTSPIIYGRLSANYSREKLNWFPL